MDTLELTEDIEHAYALTRDNWSREAFAEELAGLLATRVAGLSRRDLVAPIAALVEHDGALVVPAETIAAVVRSLTRPMAA